MVNKFHNLDLTAPQCQISIFAQVERDVIIRYDCATFLDIPSQLFLEVEYPVALKNKKLIKEIAQSISLNNVNWLQPENFTIILLNEQR